MKSHSGRSLSKSIENIGTQQNSDESVPKIVEENAGVIGILDDGHHEVLQRFRIETGNMHEHLGSRTILGEHLEKPPPEFRAGL